VLNNLNVFQQPRSVYGVNTPYIVTGSHWHFAAWQISKKKGDFLEKRVSSQDGLLRSEIFLNGFDAIAGIGDADGVGLGQFVMHQQFANHEHLKIRFRHAPELAGGQWLLANAARGLDFFHGQFCAFISIKPVKSP
jgi:hypothetical protein